MFISKMSLPRRTFLRGMGAAIALPLLDAMVPALTPLAKAAAAPRTRFGAIYIPNGAIVDEFFPKSFGTNWEFTPILKPLEPFKDQLVIVKNLTRSHPGSQVGDHAVSVGGYLTGVWPKRTEAEDVFANTTIDQVVARHGRRANRRSGFLGRTRGLALRPDRRGLPGGRDAGVHVHAGARAQPADIREPRRHRAAPHRVAPWERSRQDREKREDQ